VRRVLAFACCAAWFLSFPTSAVAAVKPDTAMVHLGAPGSGTDAFVAWPAGNGPAPAVIVVHEWWGLNDQIKEVARRLARQGYVAIVPDLYHGKRASDDDTERAHVLSRGLDRDVALEELRAAARWLRAQPRTSKARIGVIGFCMGGSLAQQLALHSDEIAAAVVFYGSPDTDPAKLAGLGAPLQGHFGAKDDGIPVSRVDALRNGLKAAGKTAEIYIYPGAGHAFMNEARPSYHPDAAKQAWARTLAFLQKYLKA
jgi:carboxymethylenebutenolidase